MAAPLAAGLGLKARHFEDALRAPQDGLWFEVHPENHLVDGGPRLALLEAVRERHPLSLHGVSLSLAGTTPLDGEHLRRLARLVRRLQPALVSEHLAWSRFGGGWLPDLLPFARTNEALQRIAARIAHVQDALRCTIAIENPSHYLRLPGHLWDEIEFLQELAARTGCTLLLDVNNVHVSANNLGFDAAEYVDRFPAECVSEIHLAGHTPDPRLGAALLVDSHDAPVAAVVWDLFRRFVARAGARPTLIERDGNVPAFEVLMEERAGAQAVLGGVRFAHRHPTKDRPVPGPVGERPARPPSGWRKTGLSP